MGNHWLDEMQLDAAYRKISVALFAGAPAFSLRKASTWGVSRAELLALLRTKRVHKIRHGAYCLSETWGEAQADERLMRRIVAAAAIACMKHPVYTCGPFAAELHELPLPPWEPATIDLVRDSGRDVRSARDGVKPANRLDGLTIVTRDLTGQDPCEIEGLPTIGLGAAGITAASRLSIEYAVAIFDAALGRGVSIDEMTDAARPWASTRGMREAVRRLALARTGAESPLESISRVRLMKSGLPEPVLQHEFHDQHGFVGRVDMWWPTWGVIGEADGLAKYDDVSVLRREKVREDRLRALGFTVVRWTWDEIWNAPTDVADKILSARRLDSRSSKAG